MTTNADNAGLSKNLVAVLCYLLGVVGGVLFLLIAPYNQDKDIRFHAFQSIFLTVAWVVFWIALNIVASIGPLSVLLFLYPLVSLAGLGLWIFLMVKAYQGERVVLPVIGPMAEQQA